MGATSEQQRDREVPRLSVIAPIYNEEAGEVFARVKPRLAVYSHAPNAQRVIAQTRKTYTGPLEGAEDMLAITIGNRIDVRHLTR